MKSEKEIIARKEKLEDIIDKHIQDFLRKRTNEEKPYLIKLAEHEIVILKWVLNI